MPLGPISLSLQTLHDNTSNEFSAYSTHTTVRVVFWQAHNKCCCFLIEIKKSYMMESLRKRQDLVTIIRVVTRVTATI